MEICLSVYKTPQQSTISHISALNSGWSAKMMPGSEPLGFAIKIADLALSNLNFFIVISAAACGWVFTSDCIATTKRFSGIRLWLAAAFLIAAGSTAYGTYRLLDRAQGAMIIAHNTAKEELGEEVFVKEKSGDNEAYRAYRQLYYVNPLKVAGPAMIASLALVAGIIVLYKRE